MEPDRTEVPNLFFSPVFLIRNEYQLVRNDRYREERGDLQGSMVHDAGPSRAYAWTHNGGVKLKCT